MSRNPPLRFVGDIGVALFAKARAARPCANVGLAFALALCSAGCSSDGTSDYGQLFQYVSSAWTGRDTAVTHEQASAIPYASLGVRIGDGPEQMLVLATGDNSKSSWTSASHFVLQTEYGRIVQSVGFAADIDGLQSQAGEKISSPADSIASARTEKFLADFGNIHRYSVPITCKIGPTGNEPITILGSAINTVHVTEICYAALLDWNFENSYWIDPQSGLVWRSVQYVHPNTDPIETETLRPPAL
jgi:hypothetical protein